MDHRHIEGWTCDRDAYGAQLSVHIYDSDTYIGATQATIEREPAVGVACGNGHSAHGFWFDFPTSIRNNRPHRITAWAIDNEGGDNPVLRRSTGPGATYSIVTLYNDAYDFPPVGRMTRSSSMFVEGWTCDPTMPGDTVWVHVYEGATFLGAARANVPNSAAGPECSGSTGHGFQFRWPNSLRDGRTHRINVFAINLSMDNNNPALRWQNTSRNYVDVNLGGGPMPTGPDLVPQDFVAMNRGYEVQFKICNIGQQPSGNFQFKWVSPQSSVGGTYVWASTDPYWTLAAGACISFQAPTFTADSTGHFPATHIEVTADATGLVVETNEGNNWASVTPRF